MRALVSAGNACHTDACCHCRRFQQGSRGNRKNGWGGQRQRCNRRKLLSDQHRKGDAAQRVQPFQKRYRGTQCVQYHRHEFYAGQRPRRWYRHGRAAWKAETVLRTCSRAKKYFRESLPIRSPKRSQTILPTKIMAERRKMFTRKTSMSVTDILRPLHGTPCSTIRLWIILHGILDIRQRYQQIQKCLCARGGNLPLPRRCKRAQSWSHR